MFKPERNPNVEFINADFLTLECGDNAYNHRADIVFINPNVHENWVDKPDIFTDTSPDILRSMRHAYKMAKNMAVLLPSTIDAN